MNIDLLKIAIAEPSVIIRSGISVALKRISGYRIQPVEFTTMDSLNHYLSPQKPDILIINPVFWGYFDIAKFKAETSNQKLKCIALVNSAVDSNLLRNYDETISLYDSVDQLKEKFDKLFESPLKTKFDDPNTLSTREKEIITCVVKGLTNKDIALALFLSTHTVISHRRNIARKLEIHSTAGLTVYAIMNKLIEIDELSKNM